MSGFGHIADMISRLKSNENLRNKVSPFRVKHIYKSLAIKKMVRFKKASKEDLASIRHKSKVERKKETLKAVWSFLITGLIACGVIYAIFLLAKNTGE